MTLDQIANMVGYLMMFAGTVTAVVFMLAIAAGYINEGAKQALNAAQNTYWWSRWIRWHRLARARKESRK